jgi:hypothetical protein
MNTNFVAVIKRIIAEQGEDVLANPQRIKGYVNDYAARESKVERLALGRCIEYGAYAKMKSAPDAGARVMVKAAVAQRVHSNEGLDVALCNDALDALEAAMFGESVVMAPQVAYQQRVPFNFRLSGITATAAFMISLALGISVKGRIITIVFRALGSGAVFFVLTTVLVWRLINWKVKLR